MVGFSVLLSVYHKEKPEYLKLALNSTVNQTLVPNEIVLIKDGKLGDELENVITSFTKDFPKIFKVIELPENRGLGNALSIGVSHCSFDLIARMDTDDIARFNRFETQYKFLEEHPEIDVVGSNIEEFNNVPGDLKRFKISPENHEDLISQIKLKSPFNHPSIMMRKSSLIKSGSYNGDILLFEDYSLFLRMWMAGLKFYNIQDVLLDFRVGDGIATIKRRSGKHYLEKESKFLDYAKQIGAYSSWDVVKYKTLKFPIRLLPAPLVLFIYNKFLRK